MIAIIPAKSNSIRVKNKNFREFYNGKSLCEITIEKVLEVLPPDKIFLSSENDVVEKTADRYGIHFLLRDPYLTSNDTPITEVIQGVYRQTGIHDDVAWCQVTNPMFNSCRECVEKWETISKKEYDSLVTVHTMKKYILNNEFRPCNFQFGPWHQISQKISAMYQLDYELSILSAESIENIGYYVGRSPYWFVTDEDSIDIDTEQDFDMARIMYELKEKREAHK